MPPKKPAGLYEELLTGGLEAALQELNSAGWQSQLESLDAAEAPRVFARYVRDLIEPLLGSFTGQHRVQHQFELVNQIVEFLHGQLDESPIIPADFLSNPARQLLSLTNPAEHGVAQAQAPQRPSIPLSATHLLINGPRDRTVISEVQRETASADRVDLLVSFLKFSGWRLLRDHARRFLERHPGGLRVLTTTYMGATDRKVLDELVAAGAQVKISYDTRRTRLHAKASWVSRSSLLHCEPGVRAPDALMRQNETWHLNAAPSPL